MIAMKTQPKVISWVIVQTELFGGFCLRPLEMLRRNCGGPVLMSELGF